MSCAPRALTPLEVWRLVLAQTGLLGGIAGVLAIPVGIGLALVLIHVINRRAFGWTIETTVPADVLVQAVGLSVLAALVAGAYPAWRMARTPPASGAPGGVTRRGSVTSRASGLLVGFLVVMAGIVAGLGLVIRLDPSDRRLRRSGRRSR